MAYAQTYDERYYGDYSGTIFGRDAPSYINSLYVLANSSIAYGTLVYRKVFYKNDTDIYSLGTLSEGIYAIDVSTYSWSGDPGYAGINKIRLLNSYGGTVETDYVLTYGKDIAFTVESSSTYYLEIVGNFYSKQEYKASYTRIGDLPVSPVSNNVATFSNATFAGTLKAGQNITASIFSSDLDGNSDFIVHTGWFVVNNDGTRTLLQSTASSTYTLTVNEVGKMIQFNKVFNDDLGNFESSSWYSVGTVLQNDTPVVASAIADATTNKNITYSYDASSSFTDADGDKLSYTAKLSNGNALPSWLSISSTGTLSGTPADADVGAIEVIVTAADSSLAKASDTFTLMVSSANVAKVIDTDGNLWDSSIDVGDGTSILPAAAQTYRSYFGALGRLPDEGGYNWWLGEIEAGRHTLNSMAAGFIDSSEFKALSDSDNSGEISNEEFILHMYNGVFGRDPDAGGLAWWVGQLDTEAKTQPDAFISMTQSNEYVELTVGTVADMMFY